MSKSASTYYGRIALRRAEKLPEYPVPQPLAPVICHSAPATRTQSFFPTYHLRSTTYQILTTFDFNNIPAFDA
jgi:hypothetical protein